MWMCGEQESEDVRTFDTRQKKQEAKPSAPYRGSANRPAATLKQFHQVADYPLGGRAPLSAGHGRESDEHGRREERTRERSTRRSKRNAACVDYVHTYTSCMLSVIHAAFLYAPQEMLVTKVHRLSLRHQHASHADTENQGEKQRGATRNVASGNGSCERRSRAEREKLQYVTQNFHLTCSSRVRLPSYPSSLDLGSSG